MEVMYQKQQSFQHEASDEEISIETLTHQIKSTVLQLEQVVFAKVADDNNDGEEALIAVTVVHSVTVLRQRSNIKKVNMSKPKQVSPGLFIPSRRR
jgi:hypothetical protein